MADNLNNGDQNDHNDSSQPSARNEYSKEALAAIHAAMMEELGEARKDELPLEDRGAAVKYKPVQKTGPPRTELAARWSNLKFDDVDPSAELLDNIADGQLYRMRRMQNGKNASQRVGHSGGTRRGGPSGRGGHTLNTGRGSGRDRTGYNGGGSARAGGFPQGDVNSSTPSSFHGRNMQSSKRKANVDAAVGNLQRVAKTAEHSMMPSAKSASPRRGNFQSSNSMSKTDRKAAQKTSSRFSRSAGTKPFALSSPEAFLEHAGVGKSSATPSTQTTGRTEQPSVYSQASASISNDPNMRATSTSSHVEEPFVHPPTPKAVVHLPTGPSEKSSSVVVSGSGAEPVVRIPTGPSGETSSGTVPSSVANLDKTLETPRAAKKPSVGLAGSRWALGNESSNAHASNSSSNRQEASKPHLIAPAKPPVAASKYTPLAQGSIANALPGKPAVGLARSRWAPGNESSDAQPSSSSSNRQEASKSHLISRKSVAAASQHTATAQASVANAPSSDVRSRAMGLQTRSAPGETTIAQLKGLKIAKRTGPMQPMSAYSYGNMRLVQFEQGGAMLEIQYRDEPYAEFLDGSTLRVDGFQSTRVSFKPAGAASKNWSFEFNLPHEATAFMNSCEPFLGFSRVDTPPAQDHVVSPAQDRGQDQIESSSTTISRVPEQHSPELASTQQTTVNSASGGSKLVSFSDDEGEEEKKPKSEYLRPTTKDQMWAIDDIAEKLSELVSDKTIRDTVNAIQDEFPGFRSLEEVLEKHIQNTSGEDLQERFHRVYGQLEESIYNPSGLFEMTDLVERALFRSEHYLALPESITNPFLQRLSLVLFKRMHQFKFDPDDFKYTQKDYSVRELLTLRQDAIVFTKKLITQKEMHQNKQSQAKSSVSKTKDVSTVNAASAADIAVSSVANPDGKSDNDLARKPTAGKKTYAEEWQNFSDNSQLQNKIDGTAQAITNPDKVQPATDISSTTPRRLRAPESAILQAASESGPKPRPDLGLQSYDSSPESSKHDSHSTKETPCREGSMVTVVSAQTVKPGTHATVYSSGKGHVPTNSDFDRLAISLGGMNIDFSAGSFATSGDSKFEADVNVGVSDGDAAAAELPMNGQEQASSLLVSNSGAILPKKPVGLSGSRWASGNTHKSPSTSTTQGKPHEFQPYARQWSPASSPHSTTVATPHPLPFSSPHMAPQSLRPVEATVLVQDQGSPLGYTEVVGVLKTGDGPLGSYAHENSNHGVNFSYGPVPPPTPPTFPTRPALSALHQTTASATKSESSAVTTPNAESRPTLSPTYRENARVQNRFK